MSIWLNFKHQGCTGKNSLNLNLVDIPRDILHSNITRRLAKCGELAKLSPQHLLARISFRRGATVRLPESEGLKGCSFKCLSRHLTRATYVSFPASRSCYLSLTEIGNQKGIVSMLPHLACYYNIKVKPCAPLHHPCALAQKMSKKAVRRSSFSQETMEVEEKSHSTSTTARTSIRDQKKGNPPQIAHLNLDNIHLDVGDVQVRTRTSWWKLWYEHFP